jgi:hypothetical protein
MRKLKPGLYIDSNHALHIDVAEMLRAHGYALTEENERVLKETARQALEEAFPGIPITSEDAD